MFLDESILRVDLNEMPLRKPKTISRMVSAILPFLVLAGTSNVLRAQTGQIKFVRAFPGGEDEQAQLSEPQSLAVDLHGNVFVVDTGNNRILKFDRRGSVAAIVGGFGWQREEFDTPVDISIKSMLDVFIADFNNQRVERYDKDLNFLSSLVADDNEPETLRFGFPTGVDISKHGELFLCDSENNRIVKFNAFGKPVLSFGDFNWGPGQLNSPVRIEVTSDDRVYVSDKSAGDIVAFDYYGNFLARLGGKDLSQPEGLVAGRDMLFVADPGNERIVVLGPGGQLEFVWGSHGAAFGAFDNPMDVALDDEYVYVLDSGNGRVQVFGWPELKRDE